MDRQRHNPTNDPSRRSALMGAIMLAAASVLSVSVPVQMAQAQQPAPAQPPGRLPNVLAIMADDIGVFNVSAYRVSFLRRFHVLERNSARSWEGDLRDTLMVPANQDRPRW